MTKRYLGNIITQNPTAPADDFANSAAKGVWSLEEQLAYQKVGLWPVPGNFPLDVEDVFSTYLYDGTSAEHTITNGIDLAGEGGMIWGKIRSSTDQHWIVDSERGTGSNSNYKYLMPNLTNGESDFASRSVSSFNSNGFTLQNGTDNQFNESGQDYASWTFRKAPKFFDCVQYTGDGVAGRTVSHNLGTTVGSIFIKELTQPDYRWMVYHRSLGNGGLLRLDSTGAATYNNTAFNSTDPASDLFTLDGGAYVNGSGKEYVAYLFAHNDGDGGFGADGDADIIKCGSYTGNGSTNGPEIDLGFEPQFVLVKRADSSAGWFLMDTMRGMAVGNGTTGSTLYVNPNNSNAEDNFSSASVDPTPTGFNVDGTNTNVNASGGTYIYMAIRRGTKVPESATEVFNPTYAYQYDIEGNTSSSNGIHGYLGNSTDLYIQGYLSGSSLNALVRNRLTGGNYLSTNSTAQEITSSINFWDNNVGSGFETANSVNTSLITYNWKRAPGYFDAVAYTGDSTAQRAISHNLGVAPEMIWVKNRDQSGYNWIVGMGDPVGWDYYLSLNGSSSRGYSNIYFGNTNTAPTDSQFYVGRSAGWDDTNRDTYTYIAYLFASLPGISKVGSYTGTGATLNINCGFTSGARFVLLKKTSSTGHWIVFDTVRGIVSGNDPFLQINRTSAEVTAYDVVDPYSSGFTLTSDPTYGLNTSGASYIFYAIA